MHVVRDLDVWGQPSFWVYQAPYHLCSHCGRRQWLIPPFKRKDVTYTYRFEEQVLRLLIGSTEEEVARRLGISAEMVATIVAKRLADEKSIDSSRTVTDIGLDEISLKKRHKLYVTILTDPLGSATATSAGGRERTRSGRRGKVSALPERDATCSDQKPPYRHGGRLSGGL